MPPTSILFCWIHCLSCLSRVQGICTHAKASFGYFTLLVSVHHTSHCVCEGAKGSVPLREATVPASDDRSRKEWGVTSQCSLNHNGMFYAFLLMWYCTKMIRNFWRGTCLYTPYSQLHWKMMLSHPFTECFIMYVLIQRCCLLLI